MKFTYPCLILSFLFAAFSLSANILDWHSNNIQFLKGNGYKLGKDSSRSLITIEHAHGWKYGDFYGFLDATRFDNGGSHFYGELAPRLSLGKILDRDFSSRWIKDYLLSFQLELGENDLQRYLGGFAIDLNLPKFKYFKCNLYLRDNPDRDRSTYQVTISWNRPITIGQESFLFEGFTDLVGDEGRAFTNYQLVVPRFLWDISRFLKESPNTLYLGTEWTYWRNKYGLDGITESVPQIQIKFNF